MLGFIRKPAVEPVGYIFKSLEDKTLVSHGDIVYIQAKGSAKASDFAAGSRYTIYRTMKPVDKVDAESTIGTQHMMIGALEVTRSEPQYAMATVVDVYYHDAVRVGDLLMNYRKRSPEIKLIDSTPGIEGSIIATEDHGIWSDQISPPSLIKGKKTISFPVKNTTLSTRRPKQPMTERRLPSRR
jgi:hypothetical protein